MNDDIIYLKQRLTELEELNKLAQILGSTLSVDEILRAIVQAGINLCHAEFVSIVLLDPASKEIVKTLFKTSRNADGELDPRLNKLMAGRVLGQGKDLKTDDIIQTLDYRNPSSHLREYGAAIAVLLMVDAKPHGVLNLVNSKKGEVFSDDSLRVAKIISSLASQFIQRAKLHETLFEDNIRLRNELKSRYGERTIIGQSAGMMEVMRKVSLLSSSSATVLLEGETGTGKELIARAVHVQSTRADKPYIAINCAAIPAALFESELFGHERGTFTGAFETRKGKLELASGGTLFLDEISEMPSELQPKLLRVLEERKFYRLGSSEEISVDVRIIAATSVNLSKAVNEGKFREALYHRLNVVPIHIPPLRERRDDIPLLANTFLQEYADNRKEFSDDAIEILRNMEWKGNVRELRNVVERISILSPSAKVTAEQVLSLTKDHSMPIELSLLFNNLLQSKDSDSDVLEVVEKNLVVFALQRTGGNISQASKILGIDRNALQRRIDKYNL